MVPQAPEFGVVFKLQGLGAVLGARRHGVGGKNWNRSLLPWPRDLQHRPYPGQLSVRTGNRSWASGVRGEAKEANPGGLCVCGDVSE